MTWFSGNSQSSGRDYAQEHKEACREAEWGRKHGFDRHAERYESEAYAIEREARAEAERNA